jgi:nicotinamidase-related amidase
VIDMIPFFCDENPYAHGVAPRIDKLAGVMRSSGGYVVWMVPAPATATARQVEFYGEEVAVRYARSGGASLPRRRLWSGVDVRSGDTVVEKAAPSAFFPGASRLDGILSRQGIDTVLIAGTVASVCCESTARDGATLDYRVIAVADAQADVSDEALNASLRMVYRSFGDVRPAEELIALLDPP